MERVEKDRIKKRRIAIFMIVLMAVSGLAIITVSVLKNDRPDGVSRCSQDFIEKNGENMVCTPKEFELAFRKNYENASEEPLCYIEANGYNQVCFFKQK